MKRNIPIIDHYFSKVNLITIVKGRQVYDVYICDKCGLKGKRHGLSDMITCNKKVKPCVEKKQVVLPKKVIVLFDGGGLGLVVGKEYEVVECPTEYKGKFDNDIWVFSTKRKEPVRLLSGEYEISNND